MFTVLLCCVLAVAALASPPQPAQAGCAGCEILVAAVEQDLPGTDGVLVPLIERLCDLLPESDRVLCRSAVVTLGEDAIRELLKSAPPGRVCGDLALCKPNNDGQVCRLFPNGYPEKVKGPVPAGMEWVAQGAGRTGGAGGAEGRERQRRDDPTYPVPDLDGDHFVLHTEHRGADWRGEDCQPLNARIHPGAVNVRGDPTDHNCNGVSGFANEGLGSTWEEVYCTAVEPRTTVIFGDSAAAAFNIPNGWVDFINITSAIPTYLDEFDSPQTSWATGFLPEVGTRSLYKQMLERNRCNMRNYQNLGVNGAKMVDLAAYQVDSLVTANSILGIVAYIGNDVCRPTLAEMTKPHVFADQLTAGLALLDKAVRNDSAVVLSGLVDGRVLWETNHNRTHPIGTTYAEFWDFLSCTGVNPCRTLLTSNATTRDLAAQRATDLSAVLRQHVNVTTYSNFDLTYYDFPLDEAINRAEASGKTAADCIEAFDGFHPSQYAQRLMADIVYEHLVDEHPSFLGEVNPQNDAIVQRFGNQGGE